MLELPALLPLAPENKKRLFSEVEAVYKEECHKPLKIAHTLSETVIHPKGIKKVNVKFALSVLHKSTIAALKEYGFLETAAVLELFAKLWSVLKPKGVLS